MKKRLFAIMLALAMLLVAVPALAEEGKGGEALETAAKIICKVCEKEVDKVNEQGLCEKCVSNLKQDDTQQKVMRSPEAPVADQTGGGEAGGTTGGTEGNAGVNTGDNTGESSNTDSTGNSGSTDGNTGNTGTNEGQNTPTNGGGEGGEQPDNPQQQCTHNNVEYTQNAADLYREHKKVCKDCKADLGDEPHQWDETTKKPKTEGTDKIPTCTNGGHWTKQCRLCGHVTVFDGPALGHDYEYHWGTWDCKTKMITADRKCSRPGCALNNEKPTTISVSEKGRDTWYSCGKKYTTVYYKVTAAYSDATVEYSGKAECTYSTSDYCRPDWYYDPCYYNNPCGHWGCGNVCTRYSNCVPCQNYRTTFRVGGYNCLATPKTGDVSVIGMALISLAGAGAAIMGKKRK